MVVVATGLSETPNLCTFNHLYRSLPKIDCSNFCACRAPATAAPVPSLKVDNLLTDFVEPMLGTEDKAERSRRKAAWEKRAPKLNGQLKNLFARPGAHAAQAAIAQLHAHMGAPPPLPPGMPMDQLLGNYHNLAHQQHATTSCQSSCALLHPRSGGGLGIWSPRGYAAADQVDRQPLQVVTEHADINAFWSCRPVPDDARPLHSNVNSRDACQERQGPLLGRPSRGHASTDSVADASATTLRPSRLHSGESTASPQVPCCLATAPSVISAFLVASWQLTNTREMDHKLVYGLAGLLPPAIHRDLQCMPGRTVIQSGTVDRYCRGSGRTYGTYASLHTLSFNSCRFD